MATLQIVIEQHPALSVCAFACELPRTLSEFALPEATALLTGAAPTALPPIDDQVRAHVRNMLRARGYKPTGRGKPSSEYLARTRAEGDVRAINAAVDACNALSLHSGLPISVLDRSLLRAPLSIRCGQDNEQYVFNATGQTIALAGLPCLCDAAGPCANAVKDAQRTKTSDTTRSTLSVIWASRALRERCERTYELYCSLLRAAGARIETVDLTEEAAAIDDAR